MRHIYSILMLISLLFVGTACEDDYRDIVFLRVMRLFIKLAPVGICLVLRISI